MEHAQSSVDKNAKGFDIFLFWNGQCVSPPRKFHLTAGELSSWENTLVHLARLEYDSTHPSIQLFTLDGELMGGPEELIDGGTYVAVPAHETFKPSGYDQYLTKAFKSREKRTQKLLQRISIEVENKEVSKDIQTEICNLCLPVENVVVIKRLETDITIQKSEKSQRPYSPQKLNSNPSLKPKQNTSNRRFSGVGQRLGSDPLELSGNKIVLNKRQTSCRVAGRHPFAVRNLSGGNNSELKTGPHVSFSRQQNNEMSKKPTTSTHFKVPESSVIKLKLPPIHKPVKVKLAVNSRESRDQNNIASAIKKQGIFSNKISRPTEIKSGTLIKRTKDDVMKKARNAFLKKMEDVQIGMKPDDVSNEIKNLTITPPDDDMKPINANPQVSTYDAVLTEFSTKFDSNVTSDLEELVGALKLSDPQNVSLELQRRNSETNKTSDIVAKEMKTSGCKESPEEKIEGNNTINERKTVQLQSPIQETNKGLEITRFNNNVEDSSMNFKIVPTISNEDNLINSTTSNLADLDNADSYTKDIRNVTLILNKKRLVNLTNPDNEMVIMQAIDNSVKKLDTINSKSSKPNMTMYIEKIEPEANKSNTGQKDYEMHKFQDNLTVGFSNKLTNVHEQKFSEDRRSTDLQALGTTDVLKVTKPDETLGKINNHGQKSIISFKQFVVSQPDKIEKNISSPTTKVENITTNHNDPRIIENDIPVTSHNTLPQNVAVIPDPKIKPDSKIINHSSNMNPVLYSSEKNNIEILTSLTNLQGGDNVYSRSREESLIANGRTVSNHMLSLLGNSHHDIIDPDIRDVDATTATLLTLYKSPTENLKSTILRTSDCASINKNSEINKSHNELNIVDAVLNTNDNNRMHDIDSYDLHLDGTISINETLNPGLLVPKLSCSPCEKKFIMFVHKSDQVNLQVNVEVRSASGTLKSKQILDANKSSTSTKRDENNDDAKLMQNKSLQSADDFVVPHTCCQKNLKVVVNKCPCCDRIASDAVNIERVTKLPSQCGIQPYYVLLPVMPPSSLTECCRRPEKCDREVQHTESLRRESINIYEDGVGDKQKPETKRVSIVSDSVLVQTSSCLISKKITQNSSTQTEWCEMLLEARMHEDGHYTFFLPPISVLQQYSVKKTIQ